MTEKEKYMSLYDGYLGLLLKLDPTSIEYRAGGYGRNFWGKGIINYLFFNQAKSICDIGCGFGVFCNVATTFADTVIGVDIASVEAQQVIKNAAIRFISADAIQIPLRGGEVEWVTSFDCLEHIPEYFLWRVLTEMRRIASVGMIVCVSSEQHIVDGVDLHMTIKPLGWWIEKLSEFGMVQKIGRDPYRGEPYLVVRFSNIQAR